MVGNVAPQQEVESYSVTADSMLHTKVHYVACLQCEENAEMLSVPPHLSQHRVVPKHQKQKPKNYSTPCSTHFICASFLQLLKVLVVLAV